MMNILRCRTNKTALELAFEKKWNIRKNLLQRNKIVEDASEKQYREIEFHLKHYLKNKT